MTTQLRVAVLGGVLTAVASVQRPRYAEVSIGCVSASKRGARGLLLRRHQTNAFTLDNLRLFDTSVTAVRQAKT